MKMLLLVAFDTLVVASGVARAQTIASAVSATTQVSEVVVTAQGREQAQMDVPEALSAYSGAFLDRVGAKDLHDIAVLTPGLVVQDKSPSNSNFVMRGVSTDDGSAYQEPRVSVFQDGVSISKSRGAFVDLFDVQRVEVVRGPQTTQFGRNALTGAIDIIDNLPDPSGFHWSLRAEGGDYGDKLATGFINVPLQDNLTVRIAGQYQHRDGYIDNVLGGPALDGNDGGAVRASLDWRPTPSYRSDLIFNYESDHTTGTSYKSETFDPTNPVTGAVLGNTIPWTALAAAEPAGFEGGGGLGERRIVASETWLNDYAFSKTLKLTSTTAVRHFQSEETYDIDGFSLPLVGSAENVRDTQYSQEFRLTNDGGGLFGWTLGASGFGDDGRQTIPLQLNEPELLSLLTGYLNRTDPAPAPASAYANPQTDAALLRALAGAYGDNLTAPQALAIANNLQPDHQEQYANSDTVLAYDLFGDLVVRPTSKIEVEGGVRFSEEHKTTGYSSELDNGRSVLGTFLGALSQPEPIRSELLSLLSVPGSAQIPSSATFPLPLIGLEVQPTARNGGVSVADLNDSGLSWKLAARYALTPDINLYANYARGRRPEVLSAAGPSAPYGQPIFTKAAAETLDSVETGLKTRLLNGALRFDAAIYGYKYNHFQTLLQQGVELLTVDAGGATTYGAEAQATWIVAPPLQLFASYAFTHARFDTGLYAGNHFRLTPDHALSGGAVLSADLGGGGQLRFTPTFSWQSKVFFNDDNANPALLSGAFIPPLVYNEYQNSYGLLNLRLSYTPARAPWQLEAFVTNALDTHYLRDAGDSGQDFGLPTYVSADPRFFGLSFTIHD